MSDIVLIVWDDAEDEDGNLRHIAAHEVTAEEVEEVLRHPHHEEPSRSTGRPMRVGRTTNGRPLCVFFDWLEEGVAYPVTAYELEVD